jgi:phosphoadenosine phosphosulfate reductase
MLNPDELTTYNRQFQDAPPRAILEWAWARFPNRLAVTVSFGGGGLILAHLVSQIDRAIPVIFLDTGLHFPETYAFKTQFAERYGLTVLELHPRTDPGPLYERDPDACCHIRKVEPMHRALRDYDAWVSAIRRDQSATRRRVDVLAVQHIDERAVLAVHPLAHWTRKDVWRYLHEHDVPYHPLLDQGYSSIGCWPCTRPTSAGEDERAGRWSGSAKTECGLHTFSGELNP